LYFCPQEPQRNEFGISTKSTGVLISP